ncbi:cytochrome c oxidase subunit II [Amaricoccus solimangrovi]|uniref:C-type cytochrome n=1 Tax=Amaricoccus solimangrovi TaxID=2589815 RepID=A0A501WPH4_9RHOB|nr:c-type cytochrome [Amaricoccus solimangrovi]TPE51663.1 c-type cytochrome [Amaricoccus solimangrovi]
MVIAGAFIWLGVLLAYLHARRPRRARWSDQAAGRLILWAGAVFPTTVLGALLTYALWLMPGLRPWAEAEPPGLVVEVTGHQFWWEITYRTADGAIVASANELRLPVGTPVELRLASPDVIHSFWIPPLAGKMDMIPGRVNRLTVTAERAGVFEGACAEYCGTSHALMRLVAVAEEPEAFRAWLAAEAAPSPGVAAHPEGRDAFVAEGCGACHTVRGTEADGRVGPDLSHLGARRSLGADTLPLSEAAIARFIADPAAVKPGALMPAYDMLPDTRRAAIAAWLGGLR